MQRLGSHEPRVEELHDIIKRQVYHMSRLIDDLLDATRLAHGKILLRKERCDLSQIVRQTAEDYRSIFDASDLRLNVHLPKNPIWVDGDPTRLIQSVGNLLHNAHKFTAVGGEVTVRLDLEKAHRTAIITVTDTGIGIEPKMLPYVFDVFRQADQGLDRSRGGLGLGLALVKGLVDLHGGDVSVTSEGAGKGSVFVISLPTASMPAAVAPFVPPAMAESAKYRILLIEDNQLTAYSTQLLLSEDGHDVRMASDGPGGLETARAFHPQIILCDIGLPDMDGYQIVRALRQDEALSGSYVIAVTGYGRDEDQRQAQEAGFDMHMTKPIDYNNLRDTLASLPIRP